MRESYDAEQEATCPRQGVSGNDYIDIYWAVLAKENSWPTKRLLISNPDMLIKDISEIDSEMSRYKASLVCPAHKQSKKNMFFLKFPFSANYTLDETGAVSSDQIHSHYVVKVQMSELTNRHTILLDLPMIFFATESVEMELLPPYLHQTIASQYGVIATGKFDISQWFRPVHLEHILWKNMHSFKCQEGEPSMYLKFYTDKKINLKEFRSNDILCSISNACATHSFDYKKNQTLASRYDKFTKSSIPSVLIKEIEKNLI